MTGYLINTGRMINPIVSSPELAAQWLVDHGWVYLDDECFVRVLNKETGMWEDWTLEQIAAYFKCSPNEAFVRLLTGDFDEDIIEWDISVEEVEYF